MRNRMKRGFTLVEILIVVVILGILAAIVIPQFSQASTDSKVASLQSNLQTIRSQIALYKIQHNDDAPPAVSTALGTTWDEMTQYSDSAGALVAAKDATHIYGPYLQSVPANPFTGGKGVGTGVDNDWNYDPATGIIHAGDDGTDATAAHQLY